MFIMKWQDVSVGPQHRFQIDGIRTDRIAGIPIRFSKERHELRFGIGPAVLKGGMKDRPVVEDLDLPDIIFPDVGIFVQAAFPPLPGLAARALMPAGLHAAPESGLGGLAIGSDVNDILHLRMIEQESVDRAVFTSGEIGAEAVDVQTSGAGL